MESTTTKLFIDSIEKCQYPEEFDVQEGSAAFRVIGSEENYIDTGLRIDIGNSTEFEHSFVFARGATGKSAFGKYASRRLNAALWNTADDLTINGHSLRLHLMSFFDTVKVEKALAAAGPLIVIIDALDEALLRVTAESWKEFKESLREFSELGVRFLILGRELALIDVMSFFEANDLKFNSYELQNFDQIQRRDFIDSVYQLNRGKSNVNGAVYRQARELMLKGLSFPALLDDEMDFLGYAPVLETVAKDLSTTPNLLKSVQELDKQDGIAQIGRIKRVLDKVLKREEEKFNDQNVELAERCEYLYTPEIQIQLLLNRMGLCPAPAIPAGIPANKSEEYLEARESLKDEHPFVNHSSRDQWASKVFEAYALLFACKKVIEKVSFYKSSAKNPFVYLLAPHLLNSELSYDDFLVASLHASYLAFRSRAETASEENISGWVDRPQIISSGGSFLYLMPSNYREGYEEPSYHSLRFVSNSEVELSYKGPLAELTISAGDVVVSLEPLERAPYLGPSLVVVADEIELSCNEVKLPGAVRGLLPEAIFITRRISGLLPRISFPEDSRAAMDFTSRRVNLPEIYLRAANEEVGALKGKSPHPWPEKISGLPTFGIDSADAPSMRIYRIVEALTVLDRKYRSSGVTRVGWCASIGVDKSKELADKILDVLSEFSIVVRENGRVKYVDQNGSRKLFATPFSRRKESLPKFADLPIEDQDAWRVVFRALNGVFSQEESL